MNVGERTAEAPPQQQPQALTRKTEAALSGPELVRARGRATEESVQGGRSRRSHGERRPIVRDAIKAQQTIASGESSECPLCLEELDAAERALRPCFCGYQVCLWCLNRLRTDCEPGQVPRCPACRTPYDERRLQLRKELNVAELAEEERVRELARRNRDRQLRQEQLEKQRQEQKEYLLLKRIRTMRQTFIIKRNMICIRGLPPSLWSERIIRRPDMFGRTGKIRRVLLVDGTGIYVEYAEEAAASRAIQHFDGTRWHGREVHVSKATVRYCEAFVQSCEQYLKLYLEWKQRLAENGQRVASADATTSRQLPSAMDGDGAHSVFTQSSRGAGRARKLPKAPLLPNRKRCSDASCMYQHEFVSDADAISRESFLQSRYGPPPPPHAFSSLLNARKNAMLDEAKPSIGFGPETGPEPVRCLEIETVVDLDEATSKLGQSHTVTLAEGIDLPSAGWMCAESSPLSAHVDSTLDPELVLDLRRTEGTNQADFCRAPGTAVKADERPVESQTMYANQWERVQPSTSPPIPVQTSMTRESISWDPVIQETGYVRRRTIETHFGVIGERKPQRIAHGSLPDASTVSVWASPAGASSLPCLSERSAGDPYAQLADAFARIGVTNVRIEKDETGDGIMSSVSPAELATPGASDHWPHVQSNEQSIWDSLPRSVREVAPSLWSSSSRSVGDKSNSVDR
jgi:hypothetical protein